MLFITLLLILPFDVKYDHCDIVEVNHVYGPDGNFVFDQLIAYSWNTTESRYDVRDWRIIPDARRPCETAKREWDKSHPNGPPYEPQWIGSSMVPVKSGKVYRCQWRDRKCRNIRREIVSKQYRETWTNYDPEMAAREVLPEAERRQLRQSMGIRENRRAGRLAGSSPKQKIQEAVFSGKTVNRNSSKPFKQFRGVGSALKYNLRTKYHVGFCGSCLKTAAEMDSKGPAYIRQNLENYANQLHKNARDNKFNWLLDKLAYAIYGLELYKNEILEAIELYERQGNEEFA